MTRRLAPVASILLACCASSLPFRPFPASSALDAPGGPLPVQWVEDFAFVDVTVEGKPAGKFLLDTGASVMLIAPEAADAIGLPRIGIDTERGGYALTGAGASTTTIQRVAPIRELRCGPLVVREFHALELDTSPLQRALGCPVAGVLPATAFRDCRLTIDYVARRVEVGAPGLESEARHTLPLLGGSLPVVTLRFGDSEVTVLLDSGSSGFLTLPQQVPMPLRGRPLETGRHQTIGGALPTLQARMGADLDWAGHTFAQPMVEIGSEARGTAGSALLRHFRVELDQSNRRVSFTRHSNESLRSPSVRGMGLGFAKDATHWTIAYLLEGTPAASSGLRVGDQVVALDGVAVSEVTRLRYDQLLAEREMLRLRVRDGDATREVAVAVAVLVP